MPEVKIYLLVPVFFFAVGLAGLSGLPVLATEIEDLVVLRDTLRPHSSEAYRGRYTTIAWTPKERAYVMKSFRRIHALAPGLLPRGASDGSISIYRTKLRNYAKGGTRFIVIDRKAFLYQNYSFRVLVHEAVHTADNYTRLSGSSSFRKIFEPKIRQARALLKQQGLTPAVAAALPIGERRKRIERMVRKQTGLPSAYASFSLAECLSEVVSFWVIPEYKYTPAPEIVSLLRPFVNVAIPPNPVDVSFRQAESLLRNGNVKAAVKKMTMVTRADPAFYQAFSARGYAYLQLKQFDRADQDLKRSRDLVSPLQSSYAFYDREWKRVHTLISQSR